MHCMRAVYTTSHERAFEQVGIGGAGWPVARHENSMGKHEC